MCVCVCVCVCACVRVFLTGASYQMHQFSVTRFKSSEVVLYAGSNHLVFPSLTIIYCVLDVDAIPGLIYKACVHSDLMLECAYS